MEPHRAGLELDERYARRSPPRAGPGPRAVHPVRVEHRDAQAGTFIHQSLWCVPTGRVAVSEPRPSAPSWPAPPSTLEVDVLFRILFARNE